ncbi:MAG: HNH endonuclease [Spirulina sp. SIO3F2]|nr:HNH endonuclease [Spirulina sp. SIO3F2]
MKITDSLRKQVIQRAQRRCEYCQLHQDCSVYSHEVDHLIARKHGCQTVLSNLALACLSCNRHKGADFATIDPISEVITPLFNPRRHLWSEHFMLQQAQIKGKTPIGKATVKILQFNNSRRILERQVLMAQGRYP